MSVARDQIITVHIGDAAAASPRLGTSMDYFLSLLATPQFVIGSVWGLFLITVFLFKGYRLFGIVLIPDDAIGVVTKTFSLGRNSELPAGSIVALKGEAGFQADTLAPGLYFFYWPWQYSIEIQKFIVIPQGKVGFVEARDGGSLPPGRVMAKHVASGNFQNARAFLENGGQRGPQMDVMTPGTYRVNTALFTVSAFPAVVVPNDKVGLVTTMEGEPLDVGEIAGRPVDGHRSYQDVDAFVAAGGKKGLQEQPLLAGTYYINPMFLNVEPVDLTMVPIGSVGVVVAYVGPKGLDTSGDTFTHGSIVDQGCKGVWATPMDPGRYPINPRTHKIELVPTTNIVLNWATGKSEAHMLDKNLSTITVRSGDGFTFNLDVSQIIHVSRNAAPKVIARFGTVQNLVTQVLEPTIGNYFRNSAQESDVIAFLKERTSRQQEASTFITSALEKYNVQAVDTLIGDITPPEALMITLTDRKVAEQRNLTFATQKIAENSRQEFEQAKAEADTRGQVVSASRAVQVAELDAQSAVKKAEGEARSKTTVADADATVIQRIGDATAKRTQAVGQAEADVLKAKVQAVGSNNYSIMNLIGKLAENGVAIVPRVVSAGGNGSGDGTGMISAMIGNLLAAQVGHGEAMDAPRVVIDGKGTGTGA